MAPNTHSVEMIRDFQPISHYIRRQKTANFFVRNVNRKVHFVNFWSTGPLGLYTVTKLQRFHMTHSNSFIDKQAYFLSYFVFFLNFYATICGELQVFECIQCALNRGAVCHVLCLTALSDAVTTPEMMPCAAARFRMPFAASFGSSAYTPPMQSEYLILWV